ncbi:DUF2252 family protein [Sphingomonas sp. MMS24-J13]|uniref:DUF2252 family protein n=1 Tax=Sphingomonas sp. MMS24-J13 TaxID=3238686 RepID=UPI00384FFDD4
MSRETDAMTSTSFAEANARYEASLRAAFGSAFVEADLVEKHDKMRRDAFLFLRATCFRWAGNAAALCPDLAHARCVPSVGDAHAGNFGLWRDTFGRLVWGVNDYDEAAMLPWPFDLVRLAVSLVLAGDGHHAGKVADQILDGYAKALLEPGPFVLARDHLWLRDAFAATDRERKDFWQKREEAEPTGCDPASFEAPLLNALGPVVDIRIARRSAGAGSLGRPRFVALGNVRGGPVAAEIKAMLPSVWMAGRIDGLAERAAHGAYRSPDPRLHYADRYVVRRLAPDNSKLDFEKIDAARRGKLFSAMGAELASIHVAEGGALAVKTELAAMKSGWLRHAAKRVAAWTHEEWKEYAR